MNEQRTRVTYRLLSDPNKPSWDIIQAIYQSQDSTGAERMIGSFVAARTPDGSILRKKDVLLDIWEAITDEKDLESLRSIFAERDTLLRQQSRQATSRYKDRTIDPRAFQLKDGRGWTAHVCVTEDIGSETLDHHLILQGTFPTREIALATALEAGKRKVDQDATSSEIQAHIDSETKLPATYRRGFGHSSDDIAVATEGEITKVSGPHNPEDRFDD